MNAKPSTPPNPNAPIMVRLTPQYRELLTQFAIDTGCSTLERLIIVILETHIRLDPRTTRERAALQAAIREGILTGFALCRSESEQGLAKAMARVEISARQLYRTKYRRGELTEGDQDTATVQAMHANGDFAKIDAERAKVDRKATQTRAKPLTDAERDAQELLGAAEPVKGIQADLDALASSVPDLPPPADE